MSGTNDFQLFATDPTANVLTTANYAADSQRTIGNQPGVARSDFNNKALRQTSIIATVVAQLVADYTNQNVVDDGTTATILANLKASLTSAISQNGYLGPCRAATVGSNITLAGGTPVTLDGVSLNVNDRILVKDQTTGSQNGLYYVSTLGTGSNGTWTRVPDAAQQGQLVAGAAVSVSEGATNAGTVWMLTTAGVITIGTTALAFARKDVGAPGFRNRLINGAMAIDQRNAGAAQTITAAAELAYTVDRWYAYCTGANVTGQRVAGTAPNKFNYLFTGAASVTKIGFAQRIEAANCQDLAGQTATLSVDLDNSLLTTVTWTAWYANTEDTFGTLASPTRTQIATGSFTVNSTLARYSTQISIPSAATTGIEVEFSVGAQTSGTWTIGRAQFEVGSVATAFEYRDVGDELRRCQRYFYAFPIGSVSSGANGTATNTYKYSYAFKQSMRVTPTAVSTGSFVFNNCQITGSALGTDFARMTVIVTATASFDFENNATWNWSAEL